MMIYELFVVISRKFIYVCTALVANCRLETFWTSSLLKFIITSRLNKHTVDMEQ